MPQTPNGFEQMYPNISQWVSSYGWIEIGDDGQSTSYIRALNEGGMVWESDEDDTTLDEVLLSLESFLEEQMNQYG